MSNAYEMIWDEPVFASSAIEFEALYESDKYVQKCTHHITKTKKSHQKSQGSEFVEFWCLRRLKRLLDWRSRAKAAKKRQQANAVFSNLSLQISCVFLRQDRLSSGFHHRLKKSKAQLGHTKSFSFFLVSPVWAVLHVQFSMKKKSHLLKYRCVSVSNFCYFIQDFCQKKKTPSNWREICIALPEYKKKFDELFYIFTL